MIRYAILYFVLLVVFVLLIAGPIVAAPYLKSLPDIPQQLLQPTGLKHNDTTSKETGTAVHGGASSATASANNRMFMLY